MPRLNNVRRALGIPGGSVEVFPEPIVATRNPNTNDVGEIGQIWINTTADDVWFLTSVSGTATWVSSAGGSPTFDAITVTGTVTFSGMSEGALVADSSGVISSLDGTDGQLLIAATAAGTAPAWATITSGDGSVVIAGGANTLDLTVSGATASTFPTDAGTATPALGATTITGGTNVNTAGAADVVTINVDNAPTFSGLLTGSAGLTISAGTTTITSDTNAIDAIYLHANGGTAETIRLHSDQGTSADSVNILSDVGGITLQAAGLASDDAINLEADSGGVDIDGAMQVNIASSEAAADAIRINASNAAGGIDVDDGGGGMAFDSLGAISLDAAAASNFSVSGAGVDLTLDSAAGRVVVDGGEATADAVRINAGAGGIDVDANTAVAIDAGTGISIDAATASNLTCAAGDLTLEATTGSVNVIAGEDAIDAIYLHADAGTSETIRLHSDQGTSADSVNILSDVGGITLQAVGLASADAINFEADAGGIDMDAALQINVASSQAAADAIRIDASNAAGGIDVDDGGGGMTFDSGAGISLDAAAASNFSVTGAGVDLTLASAAGRVVVNGEEAAANAITLLSAAGGIDADCALQMNLDSSQSAADAIRVNTSDAAGGIDVDAGTGGIAIDTTGAISLDSAAASNFTATGAFDLTLQSTAGSVLIDGGEAVADAINIDASHADGGIDIDGGTAGITIDSTGSVSIDAATASNLTCAAGDLTLEATTGSVNVNALEDAAQSIYLHADGGTSETIDIHADQGTGDTSVNIHSDAGGITLNSGIGAVLMTPQTGSVAGTSLTLHARVGVATFTGQTTGAGSNLDLTITNNQVTQGCGCFVTVSNIGTNDADITLEGVITQTAGTLTIHTQNNGAASLNGDVIVTFWIIN